MSCDHHTKALLHLDGTRIRVECDPRDWERLEAAAQAFGAIGLITDTETQEFVRKAQACKPVVYPNPPRRGRR